MRAYFGLVALICASLLGQVASSSVAYNPFPTDNPKALLVMFMSGDRPNDMDEVGFHSLQIKRRKWLFKHHEDLELPGGFTIVDLLQDSLMPSLNECPIRNLQRLLKSCEALKTDNDFRGKPLSRCRELFHEKVTFCFDYSEYAIDEDIVWDNPEFLQQLLGLIRNGTHSNGQDYSNKELSDEPSDLERFIANYRQD